MGASYWFRVAIMVAAFIGVVLTIRQLNTAAQKGQAPATPFTQLFSNKASSGKELTLCTTRITELQVIGGPFLYQKGLRWFRRVEGTEVEVDPIAVEKWFGRNCTVPAEPLPAASAEAQPAAKVSFVAGSPKTLSKGSDDEYVWQDKAYRSPQLTQALNEVSDLPPVRSPGTM